MHSAVILQARVSSTRLPKKTLLNFFDNKGIFEIIVERIKTVIPFQNIILATSTQPENDPLISVAEKLNINTFRGSENDVLQRFIDCANHYQVKQVLRICSDNVFLDLTDIERLYNFDLDREEFDYAAFDINGKPNILTHYGLWGEKVKLSSLKKVKDCTNNPFYFEHVTNYIYQNPEHFKIKWLNPTVQIADENIRLTTDTQKDFDIQKIIFSQLENLYGLQFNTPQLIKLLANKKHYKEQMRNEIIKNEKK